MSDALEQYADLPFFLKAGDALLITKQTELSFEQLRKMMPAGTNLLFLSDKSWSTKAPQKGVPAANKKIDTLDDITEKSLHEAAKLLAAHNTKRLCIIEGLSPETERTITETMKAHSIPVAVFKKKGSVSESDFMSGEDTEEFEKRLRELGYM